MYFCVFRFGRKWHRCSLLRIWLWCWSWFWSWFWDWLWLWGASWFGDWLWLCTVAFPILLKLFKHVQALLSSYPMLWLAAPARLHNKFPHPPRLGCAANVAWAKTLSYVIQKLKLRSASKVGLKSCLCIPHLPKYHTKAIHVSLAVVRDSTIQYFRGEVQQGTTHCTRYIFFILGNSDIG